jgi:transposase
LLKKSLKAVMPQRTKNTDISTRALVVGLKAGSGMITAQVAAITGLSTRQVNRIYSRAIERGFDPDMRPLTIRDDWLCDAPRSGRPRTATEALKDELVTKVSRDRYAREKSCAELAGDLTNSGFPTSATTVWRVLKKAGYRKTKPTRKPGLTASMRKQRLDWCLAHEHWTLEDWKNVIWSNETSVVLLHRRGGYRIWRRSSEAFVRSCIRERWKGASEFMFWGCFLYDKKGPCHCWSPETAKEKKEAEEAIHKLNEELEPLACEKWEIENGMRRLSLRQLPGVQPT